MNRFVEATLGPVKLLSDGRVDLGFMKCDGTASVDNCSVDGVLVNKPSGPNSTLTLTFPNGERFEAVHDGKSWCTEQDPSHLDLNEPPTRQAAVARSPVSKTTPLPKSFAVRASPWFVAIAVGVFSLVAAFYLLRPLGNLEQILQHATGFRTDQVAPEPAPPKTDPLVLSDLRLLHASTTAKLDEFERTLNGLASRFNTAVGQSVEQINASPAAWPRQINFAVKESPEFDQAFTRLRTRTLPFEQLNDRKHAMTLIDQRIRLETASLDDKQTLKDLAAWPNDQASMFATYPKDLETVETVLAKYRNDPRLRGSERSSP